VSITEEFKPRIDEKKLALKMQIPNDLPAVYTDEDKLRQVLVNLVGNSVKYTKKGEIEIIAKQTDPKFVTITIKDTGVGMSAQDREKLFDKFYRVPDEENKDIVGTGLGLWITKQLVKLMGGEIFVDSIKHVGSQFYFTIPIYSGQKEVKIAVKK
jgi:two-component system sensor histidine kinase ChiS